MRVLLAHGLMKQYALAPGSDEANDGGDAETALRLWLGLKHGSNIQP